MTNPLQRRTAVAVQVWNSVLDFQREASLMRKFEADSKVCSCTANNRWNFASASFSSFGWQTTPDHNLKPRTHKIVKT